MAWAARQGIQQWPICASRILLSLEARTREADGEKTLSRSSLKSMRTRLVSCAAETHRIFSVVWPTLPAFVSEIIAAGSAPVKHASARHLVAP